MRSKPEKAHVKRVPPRATSCCLLLGSSYRAMERGGGARGEIRCRRWTESLPMLPTGSIGFVRPGLAAVSKSATVAGGAFFRALWWNETDSNVFDGADASKIRS